MTEVLNLQALRGVAGINNGDLYYAKGHTNAGDGGGGIFMWRTGDQFKTSNPPPIVSPGYYSVDNNGTIIQAIIVGIPNDTGRWVRQYDGYINVLYFGAFGVGNLYNTEIQNAINFAELNSSDTSSLKSSTVFIPNGSYVLSNIILKNGVTILGESIGNTIIYATQGTGYLFEIEIGIVQLNISNLNIVGIYFLTGQATNKGCFLFEAKPSVYTPTDPVTDGGLWNSTIKNVNILGFNGNGIYLQGGISTGTYAYLLPNQFNIFENVRVFKNNDANFSLFSNALKMTGQIGQHTFINCEFDGFTKTANGVTTYDKWVNVSIENTGVDFVSSAVVTFLNCTIQNSDYGVRINYAENITFDNCWFENLGTAIMIIGDKERSKSINILNNRFANASGFGSLPAPNNIKDNTSCIQTTKSVVNIYNNYITATNPDGVYNVPTKESMFVIGIANNNGINCYNNTFRDNNPKLSRTYGIKQDVVVASSIDCKSNKLVFIGQPKPPIPPIIPIPIIKNITSAINAGEILIIRADGISITFDNTGNIYLTNRVTFSLANGEIASFVKIDIGTTNETYQLLSFTKTTP